MHSQTEEPAGYGAPADLEINIRRTGMTSIDLEPQTTPSGAVMLSEIWDVAVRRKWVLIFSVVSSLAAACLFYMVMPKLYRSETLIGVDEPKILQTSVPGTIEAEFEQRFFAIQKQILSRNLLGVILEEFQLYPDIVAQRGLNAAITTMGKMIDVEMIDRVPGAKFATPRSVAAFTISFLHEDPTTARRVTSRIAEKFIEDNVKTREQTAEDATRFFETEIARTKIELERKDDEIKQFKSKHMGELPQQVDTNLHTLDRLQNDLKSVNETIQRLSDRLAMVDRAIQEYHRFGTTNGALVRSTTEPDPLFRHHKELKEKLVKLRAEFWDSYPEVLLTKEEIRKVEEELMALYGPNALKPGEKEGKPLDPYLQDLKKQESEAKSELAVLKQRQDLLLAEKKVVEARVAKAPAIEQELQTLTRDYDNMKSNYQALLDKQLNARVAENLEKRQKSAQFRILDPATLPTAPAWPNLLLTLVFGFLFGSLVGVGIVVMKEQLNPQFRRPEDLEQTLEPQVLAVIPDFGFVFPNKNWKRFVPYYPRVGGGKEVNDSGERRMTVGRQFPADTRSALSFDFDIVVKYMPRSIVAEQYRVASTRLSLDRAKERSTIVGITSAVQGEGKTTTVVNLGYTMARDLGKRTVLVDCDFKRPALTRYAENVTGTGLADCLRTGVSVDECLYGLPEVPCWIMPVGKCEDESNELLKADRLNGIFDQLRDRFEYILINAPPILPLADMNVIASYVDVLLIIVRAASTPQGSVKRALNTIMTDKPVYLILNAARGSHLPYYIHDYCEPSYKK
jgi:polysaccharide chain length determinant protein (PEP-CTERM system associated)